MKKILTRGLIIGLIFVLIAFINGGSAFVMSLLMPPTIYIILGVLILAALVTIIHNQNNKE